MKIYPAIATLPFKFSESGVLPADTPTDSSQPGIRSTHNYWSDLESLAEGSRVNNWISSFITSNASEILGEKSGEDWAEPE